MQLERADFTILMRPSHLRYAKAGFPTKVVESLATATPVICNLTSDLAHYIHDMQEGIIVKDCTPEAVSDALRRALCLSGDEKREMQRKARLCAENNFDYRLYAKTLENLLKV